jgi:glutamine amidotransferase
MQATITSSKEQILDADGVILPGIGAFGDAMDALEKLDLANTLRDIAPEKPLVGICLGMQLLMTESFEFGKHNGLGIIDGQVVRFENPMSGSEKLKIPQVGWNRIYRRTEQLSGEGESDVDADSWAGSPLMGLRDGEFMYFVHSFYVRPKDSRVILSISRYGDIEFCSSLQYGNIFATQFHPERSGPLGLQIYRNLAARLTCMQSGDTSK